MINRKYIINNKILIFWIIIFSVLGCKNQENIKEKYSFSTYIADNINYNKLSKEAKENIRVGNYKRAEELYNEAKKYDVKKAYLELAQMYYKKIDKTKGEEKFEEAYEKGNRYVTIILAKINEEKKDYKKAEEWYKKGIERGETNCYAEYSKLLIKLGRENEVEKILIEGSEKKYASSMEELIKFYYRQKNEEKMKYWKEKMLNETEIIGLNHGNIKNINLMFGSEEDKKYFELEEEALLHIENKNYEKAEELIKKSIRYNKKGNDFLAEFTYKVKKDKEKGKELYKESFEKGFTYSGYILGVEAYEEKKYEEAKEWYRKVIERNDIENGSLEAKYNLAWMLENIDNEKEKGLELYREVAEDKLYPAIMKLIVYFYKNEEYEKALNLVKKTLNSKGLLFYRLDDKEELHKVYEELKEKVKK